MHACTRYHQLWLAAFEEQLHNKDDPLALCACIEDTVGLELQQVLEDTVGLALQPVLEDTGLELQPVSAVKLLGDLIATVLISLGVAAIVYHLELSQESYTDHIHLTCEATPAVDE